MQEGDAAAARPRRWTCPLARAAAAEHLHLDGETAAGRRRATGARGAGAVSQTGRRIHRRIAEEIDADGDTARFLATQLPAHTTAGRPGSRTRRPSPTRTLDRRDWHHGREAEEYNEEDGLGDPVDEP